MIEINVRGTDPYYSQRNNKVRPLASCNVTSMVAALDYAGYIHPVSSKYDQPEDNLMDFMLTNPEVDAEYQKLFPDEYKKYIASGKNPKTSYPPSELHALLSLGTNLWMGRKRGEITKFRWDLTLRDIVYEFIQKRPVVTSGVFAKLHHVICLTGVQTSQVGIMRVDKAQGIEVDKIIGIIIEDPYGDFHTNYTTQRGKDIIMTLSEFNSFINVQGQPLKWGHTFVKV